jgi:putative phosphoribosyl transferase
MSLSFANSECPGIRSAIGAIAPGGCRVLNEDAIRSYGITESLIAAVAGEELAELERRDGTRRARPIDLRNRI